MKTSLDISFKPINGFNGQSYPLKSFGFENKTNYRKLKKKKSLSFMATLVSLMLLTVACGDDNKPTPKDLTVTGLTNDTVPAKSKTWTWGCSQSPCKYRYAISQNSTHTFPDNEAYRTGNQRATKETGDGTYYIHVQAQNASRQETKVFSFSAILDNTPPPPPTSSFFSAPDSSNDKTPNITVSGQEPGHKIDFYAQAQCTGGVVGSGTVAKGQNSVQVELQQIEDERTHTYYAKITDRAGNTSNCSLNAVVNYVLDLTKPEVTGLTSSSAPRGSVSWSWSCNDVLGCTYRHAINKQSQYSFPTNTPFTNTTTASQNSGSGTYYIHVQAKDVSGNLSDVARASATLDSNILNVIGIVPQLTPKKSHTWNWNCNRPPCTYRHAINQSQNHTFASSLSYTATQTASIGSSRSDGTYYLHVQAREGNVGRESKVLSVSVILDNTPPKKPSLSVTSPGNNRTPDITVSNVSPGDQITLYRGSGCTGESQGSKTVPGSASSVVITAKELPNTSATYRYYAKSRDAAGNESLCSDARSYVLNIQIEVTGIAPDTTPKSSKTWNWGCTNNSGTCTYRHAVNTSSTYTFPSNTAYNSTTTKTISIGSTYTARKYYLHVQAKDASNNTSDVKTVSVTLKAGAKLEVTGIAPDATPKSSKTWNWGCTNNSGTCTYRHVVNTSSTYTFPSNTAYNSTKTKTISIGSTYTARKYYLHVQAKDASNNVSDVKTASVTLQQETIEKLIVTGLSPDTTNPISKTWTWGCSRGGTAQTCTYRHVVNTNPSHTFENELFNATRTKTITRNTHTPGTMYYIHVQAKDSSDVKSAVDSASVTLRTSGLMVTGLQHNSVPAESLCFPTSDINDSCSNRTNWGCSYNGLSQTCKYRVAISRNSTHTFNSSDNYVDYDTLSLLKNQEISLTNSNNDPLTRSPGIYYLHVQAKDDRGTTDNTSDDRISLVQSVYGVLSTPGNAPVHAYTFKDEDKNKTATTCIADDEVWDQTLSKCKTVGNRICDEESDCTKDTIKKSSKTWDWDCSRERLVTHRKTCQFRFAISQRNSHHFANNVAFTSTKTATKTIKTRAEVGKYYLHVQAKDSDGHISKVHTTSAVLDFVPKIVLKTPTPTPCFNKASTTLCQNDVHALQLHRDRTPAFTVSGLANGEKVKLYSYSAITIDNTASPKTCTIDESKATTAEGTIAFAEGDVLGKTEDLEINSSLYDGVHKFYIGIKDESKTPAVVKCAYATDPGSENISFTNIVKTEYVVYQPIVAGRHFTCYLFNNNKGNTSTTTTDDDNDWVGKVNCWGGVNDHSLGSRIKFIAAGKDGPEAITTEVGDDKKKAVSEGSGFNCAILESDDVTCWGSSDNGQIGLEGGSSSTFDPTKVVLLGCENQSSCSATASHRYKAKAIASGLNHTCVHLNNDRVKCWGKNDKGQLGQDHANNIGDESNEMGNSLIFTKLGSSTRVKAITASGDHSCAVLSSGSVKCWGKNDKGQLGQNNITTYGNVTTRTTTDHDTNTSTPDLVSEPMSRLRAVSGFSGVKALSAGGDFNCAVLSGDTVKCWGGNDSGQLGQNNTITYGNVSRDTRFDVEDTSTDPSTWSNTGDIIYRSLSGLSSFIKLGCHLTGRSTCPSNQVYKVKTTAIATGFTTDGGTLGTLSGNSVSSPKYQYNAEGRLVANGTGNGGHACAVLKVTDSNTDLHHVVKCWGYNGDSQLGLNNSNVARGWSSSHKVETDGTSFSVTPSSP